MALRLSTLVLLRYTLILSLLLLLTGMFINIFVVEGKSAVGMLVVALGWLGTLASGVVLLTKRVPCPRCNEKWIPVRTALEDNECCRYCSG